MLLNENDSKVVSNTGDYEYGVVVNAGSVVLNISRQLDIAAETWDATERGVITLVAGSTITLTGDGSLELARL